MARENNPQPASYLGPYSYISALAVLCFAMLSDATIASEENRAPLRIIVMDPLAEPLSCACVDGVGQRKYGRLATFLQTKLGRPVEVIYEESLNLAFDRAGRNVDLVIGKQAVVVFDAKVTKTNLRPLCRLSDRAGRTHVSGTILVPTKSKTKALAELSGTTLILGPPENAELNEAVLASLRELKLQSEVITKTAGSIESGVFAVSDGEADATVVPDFMPPLLEGCGKVAPGALRVIGQTKAVPFVTVFLASSVSKEDERLILESLLSVKDAPKLLEAMESKNGFVSLAESDASVDQGWTDWRGPGRIGHSTYVPQSLPKEPTVLWTAETTGPALAGIAATSEYVVVPDKNTDLTVDIFRCFHASNGKPHWTLKYVANLDIEYTNAPRATPVIHEGLVYLQSALGDLHCVELASGQVKWARDIVNDFGADRLNWGSSSPPLVSDELLVINPGAKQASVVALNRKSGEVVWQTPGHAAAYSAFIEATIDSKQQLIGYDVAGLGGWDRKTGKRLWEFIPKGVADFNVGTPLLIEGKLLVATENNATRLYGFNKNGMLNSKPLATNEDLAPDTCTPVVWKNRVFCTAYGEMFCLNLDRQLETVWSKLDDMFYEHTNLIAGNDRVLVWTTGGDLLLIRADTQKYEQISHFRPFLDENIETMSHPAIVKDRIYVRSQKQLACLSLSQE